MVKVVILRSNSTTHDTRVKKLFKSLNKKYSVSVIGWNREAIPKKSIPDYTTDLHLLNLRAPIGKQSIIGYYPFFWIWIFFQLIKQCPKIIHACDLDTVPPAYLYKLIFRKKLIFDIFDSYAMGYINPNSSLIYKFVLFLEEFYAKRADRLLVVWVKMLDTFKNKPLTCSVIMNCAEDIVLNRKPNNEILKIVYTGNIVRNRGLEVISAAIRDLKGTELVFAGRDIDKTFLNDLIKINNVHYLGILSNDDALKLEGEADVIIALYDQQIPLHRFTMANKLLLAMMLGVPTITNIGKEIIQEINCGVLVDYNNIEQIKQAVIKLRDDKEYRNVLGKNGRSAFIQKYNWNKMETELYQIYENI